MKTKSCQVTSLKSSTVGASNVSSQQCLNVLMGCAIQYMSIVIASCVFNSLLEVYDHHLDI